MTTRRGRFVVLAASVTLFASIAVLSILMPGDTGA
jgi:hypothetical protein